MQDEVHHIVQKILYEEDIFKRAKLMKQLREEYDVRLIELAKYLNLQPSYVSHYLRLNKLPEIIIDGYYAKQVSASHLFIIARLPDYDQMLKLYEQILSHSMTSAQTEEAVREVLYKTKSEGERMPALELEQFAEEIRKHYANVEVKVVQTRIKSKLILETKGSLETTTKILRRIQRKLIS